MSATLSVPNKVGEGKTFVYRYTWTVTDRNLVTGEPFEINHMLRLPNEAIFPYWVIKLRRVDRDGHIGLWAGLARYPRHAAARETTRAGRLRSVAKTNGEWKWWAMNQNFPCPGASSKYHYGWAEWMTTRGMMESYIREDKTLVIDAQFAFSRVVKGPELEHISLHAFQRDMDQFLSKQPDAYILIKEPAVASAAGAAAKEKSEKSTTTLDEEGEIKIPIHTTVLSARSEVFKNMFQGGGGKMSEQLERMLDLRAYRPAHVRLLVDYLYGRKVELKSETFTDALHMFKMAEMYNLEDLCEILAPTLVGQLRTENDILQVRGLMLHLHKNKPALAEMLRPIVDPELQRGHFTCMLDVLDRILEKDGKWLSPSSSSASSSSSSKEPAAAVKPDTDKRAREADTEEGNASKRAKINSTTTT